MGITHYCKVCGKQLAEFESECSRCSAPTGLDPAEQRRDPPPIPTVRAEETEPAAVPEVHAGDEGSEKAIAVSDGESKWQKRGHALLWVLVVMVVLLAAAASAVFIAFNGSVSFDDIISLFGR